MQTIYQRLKNLANHHEMLAKLQSNWRSKGVSDLSVIDQSINMIRNAGLDNVADIIMSSRNDLADQFRRTQFQQAKLSFDAKVSGKVKYADTLAKLYNKAYNTRYTWHDILAMEQTAVDKLYKRAEGKSYQSTADELEASRQTLRNWAKDLEE